MKKRVLFVCVENSCRSQMAEGFAKKYGGHIIESYSAGSKPSRVVNHDAIKVMKELGIDISGQGSKGFEQVPYTKFNYVVTMGCGDACPQFSADERVEWEIEDPKGRDLEHFRKARDEIGLKVSELVKHIGEER